MKIYATQIPPEYQESPLLDDWPENVYTYGNRNFCARGIETIENIKNNMYNAADELKRLMEGEFTSCEYSLIEILNDFVPCDSGRKYSRPERLNWRELLLAFDNGTIDNDDAITAALTLITGDEYNTATIRGCCQSDWENVIFPKKYGTEWLKNFETEYFNTGSEWNISEGEPDGYETYCLYAHGWDDDEIRAEIADAAGVTPDNVTLYKFTGWSRTAEYTEVTA